MSTKLRISAGSIAELRDFLAESTADMGCRPVAVRRGARYATDVIADEAEKSRLGRQRAGSVQIEVLEELPPPARRLRMAPAGNRFADGAVPRGLGRKE